MYIESILLEYEESCELLHYKHLIGLYRDVLELAKGMISYV